MRVLAIEPYFGGSHRAFLEGWAARSRHEFVLRHLPAHHWKWRMRLGAAELAEGLAERFVRALHEGQSDHFDAVWASSMLDVGLWRGVAPPHLAALPHVLYFHENQFAYPGGTNENNTPRHNPRDLHFGLTNFTAALASLASGPSPWKLGAPPRLWWNSAYNRDSFTVGAGDLLAKSPERSSSALQHWLPRIAQASAIQPPGIEPIPGKRRKAFGKPPHLVWAARWEHDKQPELFFRALHQLEQRGVDFRISVLGERFQLIPAVFEQAQKHFAPRIEQWGFQADRKTYTKILMQADVFVSTAAHEFFGIAAVEAGSAGCSLVLPEALSYPEVFGASARYYSPSSNADPSRRTLESANALADTLSDLLAANQPRHAGVHVQRYAWSLRARELDDALEAVAMTR